MFVCSPMGKKKSHEKWAKEQALKKKQQEDAAEGMDVVGEKSELRDLEACLLEDDEDEPVPMEVDQQHRPNKAAAKGLKLKKIEKVAGKEKKQKRAVKYMERLEAKLAKSIPKKKR